MEIVTEPDIRTAEQARRYAEELQLLLRAIGASDADMERGQMRVEANVSLRPRGTEPFGTRVEVKNMNSFRAVERAIAYEIERQAAALDAGEPLVMETRGWDDGRQATYRMRAKETSDDYRYFPEPDLPPLARRRGLDRPGAGGRCRSCRRRAGRGTRALGLSAYDAAVLVADPAMTTAFEAILGAGAGTVPAKEVANFVTGAHARVAKASGYNAGRHGGRLAPGRDRRAPRRDRRRVDLPAGGPGPARPAPRRRAPRQRSCSRPPGPGPISDDAALLAHVDAVIAANPKAVADYRAGKPVVGFLVGQVMKATGGAADAAQVAALVRGRLDGEG